MSRLRGRIKSLERKLTCERSLCRACDGQGYPGLFVQRSGDVQPRQVGDSSCRGCGRVRLGAVVVLDDAEEWIGAGETP